jgi:uncharacterized membrane protein
MAAGKSRRQVRPRGRRSRGPESSLRSEGSTSRLQALTDGFFAVTMTLLVLDLSAGQPGGAAAAAVLRAAWPHLLLYFDSMLILGALWFGNRNAFEFVRRTDHPHTWLSLGELAFVALVPWTTTLVALHLHAPLAVAVYTGNLAVITWLDAATWIYATGRSGLATGMTPRLTRVSRGLACVPAAGFTVAAGAGDLRATWPRSPCSPGAGTTWVPWPRAPRPGAGQARYTGACCR